MLLALYIGCLIFGGVFVGLSVISGLGDSDADVDKEFEFDKELEFDKDFEFDKEFEFDKDLEFELDADADADVDADADGDAEADKDIETHHGRRYIPFLSFKFYTFSAAFFGLTGTVLTLLSSNVIGVFITALVVGLGSGLGMTYLLHVANRSEGGRVATGRDLAGMAAQVTLPIRPGKTGKVKFRLKGQVVEMMARNVDEEGEIVFDFGEECFILGIEDGVVQVAHPSQLRRRGDA